LCWLKTVHEITALQGLSLWTVWKGLFYTLSPQEGSGFRSQSSVMNEHVKKCLKRKIFMSFVSIFYIFLQASDPNSEKVAWSQTSVIFYCGIN
jgi:hypothetical protein